MKSIVCWLWNDGFRAYSAEHVNVLFRMFRRCLPEKHRFICITDEPGVFDVGIEVMSTPPGALALAHIRTPEGARFPSCYRRLWMFSPDAKCLGERVMLVDIDVVLTGDVTHLFDSDADFVGWRPRASWGHNNNRIGGGLYVMTPGTRAEVWDDFKGHSSIAEARAAGFRGSDQAWMSYKLQGCDLFPDVGIYSIRDLKDGRLPLPDDARLVQFNGSTKPWQSRLPWVLENWR